MQKQLKQKYGRELYTYNTNHKKTMRKNTTLSYTAKTNIKIILVAAKIIVAHTA